MPGSKPNMRKRPRTTNRTSSTPRPRNNNRAQPKHARSSSSPLRLSFPQFLPPPLPVVYRIGNTAGEKLPNKLVHNYKIVRVNSNGRPVKVLVNIDELYEKFKLYPGKGPERPLIINEFIKNPTNQNIRNAGYMANLARNAFKHISVERRKKMNERNKSNKEALRRYRRNTNEYKKLQKKIEGHKIAINKTEHLSLSDFLHAVTKNENRTGRENIVLVPPFQFPVSGTSGPFSIGRG